MNSRYILAALLMGPFADLCPAHDPVTTKLTWTQEITRIVNRHCVSCHAEFQSYQTARPWAKAIRDEVISRRMPPWGAEKGVGDFAGDPSLSGPEIEMLVAWVEGGAPEGNPSYLPHLIPAPEPPAPLPRYNRAVAVSRELRLDRPGRVVALRPRAGKVHGSLEAWAVLPDGTVERLIRIPDSGPAALHSFALREPALLPAGTRLRVQAGPAGSCTFYLK